MRTNLLALATCFFLMNALFFMSLMDGHPVSAGIFVIISLMGAKGYSDLWVESKQAAKDIQIENDDYERSTL